MTSLSYGEAMSYDVMHACICPYIQTLFLLDRALATNIYWPLAVGFWYCYFKKISQHG